MNFLLLASESTTPVPSLEPHLTLYEVGCIGMGKDLWAISFPHITKIFKVSKHQHRSDDEDKIDSNPILVTLCRRGTLHGRRDVRSVISPSLLLAHFCYAWIQKSRLDIDDNRDLFRHREHLGYDVSMHTHFIFLDKLDR